MVSVEAASTATTPEAELDLSSIYLESLSIVQASIVSCFAGVPYSWGREVARLSDEDKQQLRCATQAVVSKHARWFEQNQHAIEFVLALTAAQAIKVDGLLAATETVATPGNSLGAQPPVEVKGLSLGQVVTILGIIFAPVLALLMLYLLKRKKA